MHAYNRTHCVQCADVIDVTAPGNGEVATGVLVNRSGGGANYLALSKRTGRWLCRFCIDRRRHGLSWEQPSLFDDEVSP